MQLSNYSPGRAAGTEGGIRIKKYFLQRLENLEIISCGFYFLKSPASFVSDLDTISKDSVGQEERVEEVDREESEVC